LLLPLLLKSESKVKMDPGLRRDDDRENNKKAAVPRGFFVNPNESGDQTCIAFATSAA